MRLPVLTMALMASGAAFAQVPVPEGYPAEYAEIIEAGIEEGTVAVYAPLDVATVQPLFDDFSSLYPGITVSYNDLNTTVMYNRFITEAAGGASSADIVWSSAIDLQAKLVADGYAEPYVSPEVPDLPEWAFWEEGGYGTTFEPFVFVYNKELVPEDLVPQDHAEMVRVLQENPDLFRGKIATYNIETSGVGFYIASQDAKLNPNFGEMVETYNGLNPRLYTSAGEMVESIGSGENVFGYNIQKYYADQGSENPAIGVVVPSDYAVVMSRLAFINANAAHPNAAKLFLDYLLSERGQTMIAETGLCSLREDLETPCSAAGLAEAHGDVMTPPTIGPDLLEYLDQAKRLEFLESWKAALRNG